MSSIREDLSKFFEVKSRRVENVCDRIFIGRALGRHRLFLLLDDPSVEIVFTRPATIRFDNDIKVFGALTMTGARSPSGTMPFQIAYVYWDPMLVRDDSQRGILVGKVRDRLILLNDIYAGQPATVVGDTIL